MISLKDVTKHYQHTTALDHVTAEFSENKIYCLLGRNGAGKTTLLKLIAGHINTTSGQINVYNHPVNTSMMPECVNFIENRAAQFNTKVGSLLQMARDLDDDFDYDYAQSMVKRFRLDDNKKYKQLSFGMQTMLTTLMGLASNSKVVLLDEPVLGFDAIMRKEFYELLNDSFENHPRLIIISTHLIDEIAKSAEQLVILDKGKIIFQASVNDIDEKAYSITGRDEDVKSILDGLNVIGRKTIGGYTTAFIFDERDKLPPHLTVQPIGLQDFFVNMVGGNENE
jgi:ABC-2 type transport system ATP-binding protein